MKRRFDINTFLSYFIVLMPILGQYGFLTKHITIADMLLIPLLLVGLLKKIITKKIVITDILFLLFTLWYVFAPLLGIEKINSSSMTSMLKCFIYSIAILSFSNNKINLSNTQKFYTQVVMGLSIIIFIQYFIYFTTGIIRPWVINSALFPAVYVNDDYFSGGYLVQLGGDSFRPSSIFSEPALFAQYTCPCLIMNMFSKSKKKKIYFFLIVTIAIFLTKSANGIMYILAIWLFSITYTIYKYIKNKKTTIKSIYILAFFIVVFLITIFYNNIVGFRTNSDSLLLSRLTEIFDSSGQTSGSMRVVRGWTIYDGLTWYEKIFGIGTGNIILYLDMHPNIVKMFSKAYNGYMSGLSAIFVNSGLIGGILFFIWLIKIFIKNNNEVKCLSVFLLLYLIASNSLFTINFVMIVTIIIHISLESKKHNEIEEEKSNENNNNYIT